MNLPLYIPWFKAEPWHLPVPGTDWELPLQPFGVLVMIAVLVGARMSERWGQRNGIEPSTVNDMLSHVLISAFLAGWFLNAAFYRPEILVEIAEDPSRIFSSYLGLSSYGGFIGAVVGLLIWWRRRGTSPIAVGEAACFGFPFGWIFGRTGCFVVHDHPGRVTEFPLAVADYQVGYPPFQPRHDLGLYEVFWSLTVSAAFWFLARKPRPRGFYMAALPLAYAPVRFFLDYLRADPVEGGDVRYLDLTPAQWGSIALFAVGSWVAWRVAHGTVPAHEVALAPPGSSEPESSETPSSSPGDPTD